MHDPSDFCYAVDGHGYNEHGEVRDMRAGIHYDETQDRKQYLRFGRGKPARLSIMERIAENNEAVGRIENRGNGTYTMWPTRALSAQTRLKNQQYELPSSTWTNSPEGYLWEVRVPALPKVINLNTMNNYSVQRDNLGLIPGLQMETQTTWYTRIKQALFNNAHNQSGQVADAAMRQIYPSIFMNQMDI